MFTYNQFNQIWPEVVRPAIGSSTSDSGDKDQQWRGWHCIWTRPAVGQETLVISYIADPETVKLTVSINEDGTFGACSYNTTSDDSTCAEEAFCANLSSL